MPTVVAVPAVEVQQVRAVELLGIDAVIRPLFQLSAVLDDSAFLVDVSSLGCNHSSARFRSLLGKNIDHAVHGVRSPYRSSGASNHFNSRDILEGKIQDGVPKNARKGGGVHHATVDHYQQLIAELLVESTRTDGPGAAVDLRNVHSWHHP